MRRPRRPILLVGIDDAEIRAVAGALDELGFPYHFLGTRMPIELDVSRSRIAWRLGPGLAAVTWSPGAPSPRPFAAVYTRVLALAPTHPFDSPHWTRENFLRAGFYDGEILGLKLALLRHLQAWRIPMYNGFAAADMEVKAFRLLRMREAGLPVPESLFTQDGKSVRKLAARRRRPQRGTSPLLLVERFLGPAPVEVVVQSDALVAEVAGEVLGGERHDALGMIERQTAEDGAVDDAECRGGQPDTEAQGDRGRHRMARRLGQHAQAITHIAPDSSHRVTPLPRAEARAPDQPVLRRKGGEGYSAV
ncbi:MAG TPA: hypothetical protein VHQ90_24955 [Thermoanaerobaculia bacterium]|nr:hypothetical protein [Thermoanaerobaculia bacterium]